jgi:hypothetical protein
VPQNFVLQPNPNQGSFSITGNFKELQNPICSIYTAQGQLLWQGRPTASNSFAIEQELLQGLYVFEIKSDKLYKKIKFVVTP